MRFYEMIKKELDLVESEIESLMPKEPNEVYKMLLPFIKRGGKRIRPALLILCCGAVGGNKAKSVKLAALIEVFHSFTLIHDDVCDNSLIRRGLPTINVQYGVPVAINSGDALYTLLWKSLSSLELAPDKLQEIMKTCADAFLKVVEGQGIELNWHREKTFDIDEKMYLTMVEGKTASLMALSCELGGMVGCADAKTIAALKEFGKKLGVAFQIRDDVLNLIGNFEEYKKEIGGDISEGKRTIMVIHALKHATKSEREELLELLTKKTSKTSEINRAIEIIKRCGSIDYACKKTDEIADAAKKSLEILPDSPEKNALLELTDYVTYRSR